LVPSAVAPTGRTETLASQRRLPSSMLPSLTPSHTRISRSRVKNSDASAGDRMSGSLTISMSGTPLRL
jgi:hypothetical protein